MAGILDWVYEMSPGEEFWLLKNRYDKGDTLCRENPPSYPELINSQVVVKCLVEKVVVINLSEMEKE